MRETLASILSLSFFHSTGQSSSLDAVFYYSLYFDRGKIKMNDISARTRPTPERALFSIVCVR